MCSPRSITTLSLWLSLTLSLSLTVFVPNDWEPPSQTAAPSFQRNERERNRSDKWNTQISCLPFTSEPVNVPRFPSSFSEVRDWDYDIKIYLPWWWAAITTQDIPLWSNDPFIRGSHFSISELLLFSSTVGRIKQTYIIIFRCTWIK